MIGGEAIGIGEADVLPDAAVGSICPRDGGSANTRCDDTATVPIVKNSILRTFARVTARKVEIKVYTHFRPQRFLTHANIWNGALPCAASHEKKTFTILNQFASRLRTPGLVFLAERDRSPGEPQKTFKKVLVIRDFEQ